MGKSVANGLDEWRRSERKVQREILDFESSDERSRRYLVEADLDEEVRVLQAGEYSIEFRWENDDKYRVFQNSHGWTRALSIS